jgi:hypothetical protein
MANRMFSIDSSLDISRLEIMLMHLWRWAPSSVMKLLSAIIPSRQIARNRRFREMANEIGRKMLKEQRAAGLTDEMKKDVMSVLSKNCPAQRWINADIRPSPGKHE